MWHANIIGGVAVFLLGIGTTVLGVASALCHGVEPGDRDFCLSGWGSSWQSAPPSSSPAT